MYYGKKEGYKNFGLQHLPTTQVSEYNAKLAIQIGLLLKSLAKSSYGQERWTLPETSAELILTPPKNCFKKNGFTVTVIFDDDPQNSMVYTQWNDIYYQDENDRWHKVQGKVDHNGLFFDDINNERNYFQLFAPDAERFSKTGLWTVHYKNTTVSSIVTSSSKHSTSGYSRRDSSDSSRCSSPQEGPSNRRPETPEQEANRCTTTSTLGSRRRRREQGESTSDRDPRGSQRKRRRPLPSPVSAEEVGQRHHTLPRTGLSRLGRLTEEARDPPLILVKGPANNLKCWRYRCNERFGHLFNKCSSVFRWIDDPLLNSVNQNTGRMLIAFNDNTQRQRFLDIVTMPRGTSFAYGSVDSL